MSRQMLAPKPATAANLRRIGARIRDAIARNRAATAFDTTTHATAIYTIMMMS